jgi:hypothetical protein
LSGGTPVSISGKADTVLTTKGDIVGYDTVRKRIGIGSNDQVLTADSTNANGLLWKTASSEVGTDLTTKGDIHGYDTTQKRIPIGTNDQVLTADSTQALGLKWATAGGGQIELISKGSAVTSSSTVTLYDSTNLTDTNYTRLTLIIRGGNDSSFSNPMKVQLNNLTSNYSFQGTRYVSGTVTDFNLTARAGLECAQATTVMNANEGFYVILEMDLNFLDEPYLVGKMTTFRFGDVNIEYKNFLQSNTFTGISKIVLSVESGDTITGSEYFLYGEKV